MSETPQQFRLREVCRHLLAAGIKPTPTVLETFESSFVRRTGRNNIAFSHGRLGAVRRQEFLKAGWTFGDNGRWNPPAA